MDLSRKILDLVFIIFSIIYLISKQFDSEVSIYCQRISYLLFSAYILNDIFSLIEYIMLIGLSSDRLNCFKAGTRRSYYLDI